MRSSRAPKSALSRTTAPARSTWAARSAHSPGRSDAASRRSTSTGAVSLWNPNIEGNVNALALDGNTVYAVGTFARAGGITRSNAVAIDRLSGTIGPGTPTPTVKARLCS